MTYEPKEGSASLFKNTKTKDSQPDWRGTGLFQGKKIKISAWQKQSAKGETYFSMKVEEDNYIPQVKNVERPKQSTRDDLDSGEIPF